ncbi:MAG: NAD-dependent epimerase/dehydratase family protein [Candidatus Parcubacteria bacterium]|nr:NAD-dependent epimerase/dehydratase family protein [Candidatus Parcubacteria bacterium]
MQEKNEKTKVVVTGGAGFIGSNLVDALVEKGWVVHVVDNLSGGKKERVHPEAVFHEKDIRNLEEMKEIMKGAKYVFHLAALPRVQFSIEHPIETNDVNVNGTLNVLLASKEAGVSKVIYSASSSAYGDQDIMPLHEGMPAHPKSPYGFQKHIGELYCRLFSEVYELPTVSLRYFNVYGPKVDPDAAYALAFGLFLRLRKEGKPITVTGDGTQTRDMTHVLDVVRANILAAETDSVGNGEVINIGSGKNNTINYLAELMGGEIIHIAPRLEPHDTLADNSLAKKLLGWEPIIHLKEGIEQLKKEFGIAD